MGYSDVSVRHIRGQQTLIQPVFDLMDRRSMQLTWEYNIYIKIIYT